jgi:peptidoglycan/xylan/chitin deacetylase (PgdA/CDA1 family)
MNLRAAFAILLFSLTVAGQAKPPERKMALTFDDLPYIGVGQSELGDARRVTAATLATLKAHHAPAAAFVNEAKLQVPGEVKARTDLLQQWVNAGMILGNHTYSHPDFNRLSIQEFEDEIVRGDVITRELMSSRKPYQLYFRHPMTHTGDTVEKKEAIERFLAARGYKVTPHTIENSDFIFNVDYVLAIRDKDGAAAAKIRDAYLDFTIAATEFAEKISPQIFGREVPQTLLIHANDLNADCLGDLLKRFEARGYRFVTLDEAMKDPAYATKDTSVSKMGPTWFWRWMKSKGMILSFAEDPDPPAWIMTPYQQWLAARFPR